MAALRCDNGSPNYPFDYCPSTRAALLFSVLFGLTTVVHVAQAWHYRKAFLWVLTMGGVWELIGFTTRVAEIKNPANASVNRTSFLFIILAPMWINASDYMLLGRMVYFYMPDKRIWGFRAERIAAFFVVLDITSFFIQLAGGLMTVNNDPALILKGFHVYTAGVSIQEAVILSVVVLTFQFQRRLNREVLKERLPEAKRLLVALFVSLALITFRIGFRIVEFSGDVTNGVNRVIYQHEFFVYVFDAAPMFLALVTFNVYHPGRILVGPNSEFQRLTKEEKREVKLETKRLKMEQKMAISGRLELSSLA